MKVLAIITARGGSKRIPRKNIKEFMGKPMIAYAIEAAINSKLFSEVMVSTDDNEIAEIARQHNAKVPFMRSAKTASDFATTYDVLEEVISNYQENDEQFEAICCIYPCVPFLTSDTLKKACNAFVKGNFDALQPVCKYPVPIEWAMKIEQNILTPFNEDALQIRSQDLTPKYFDVGMFYFCKTDILINEKTLTPKNTSAFIINESECQDIDTFEDWKMAELKYTIKKEGL